MSNNDKKLSILPGEWISLDLETTGLSPNNDKIIEVGAVKFKGSEIIDTFSSFVNPHSNLSPFIKKFTGITQHNVDNAPELNTVIRALISFIGSLPVIGHNINFDLRFLDANGCHLTNSTCDTWDMAYVFFPSLSKYSLQALTKTMAIDHLNPHRALEDAKATKDLFIRLVDRVLAMDLYLLSGIRELTYRSSWSLHYLMNRLETLKTSQNKGASLLETPYTAFVGGRFKSAKPLKPNNHNAPLDIDLVTSLFDKESPLAEYLDVYEERSEQLEMARAVAESINSGGRLIIEAGTGVGKSLAYLVPATLYALLNNKRVVISTNTINLQEQLLNKDALIVKKLLETINDIPDDSIRFAQLKGRANYICLKRWSHLLNEPLISEDDARFLAKTMVWLTTTKTGDKGEINFGNRSNSLNWDRISALGTYNCLSKGGDCFLRTSRETATSSHVTFVNHSLLLSDLTSEGSVIPEHDILIIDEAHHLEEIATKQFGFTLSEKSLTDHIQELKDYVNIAQDFRTKSANSKISDTQIKLMKKYTDIIVEALSNLDNHSVDFFKMLTKMLITSRAKPGAKIQDCRVTESVRARSDWLDLKIHWENLDVILSEQGSALLKLKSLFEILDESVFKEDDNVIAELDSCHHANLQLRDRLNEFVYSPSTSNIYWINYRSTNDDININSAPLHVGSELEKLLFSRKDTVILTGATLSTNENFNHIVETTGFRNAKEILLGSPFNYPEAALICIPSNMPVPNSAAYQSTLESIIKEAVLSANGHTMALFTSHAALRSTANSIRRDTSLSLDAIGRPGRFQGCYLSLEDHRNKHSFRRTR